MQFPKTKAEFISLLNQSIQGWKFIGTNPFSDTNLKNSRLVDALYNFSKELYGDEDIGQLMEDFEELPNTISEIDLAIANALNQIEIHTKFLKEHGVM